mmetsp:Transcript_7735/g.24317  ORF Transcript_7735/g.24317 Transcript_7735/m.24317 type:complete len:206 (+) Transcript_7735:2116-2733(+)
MRGRHDLHHAPERRPSQSGGRRRAPALRPGHADRGLLHHRSADGASARRQRRGRGLRVRRRAGVGRRGRRRGGHAGLHGRRDGRRVRARGASPKAHGQDPNTLRARGRRPSGQAREQSLVGATDARHGRGLCPGRLAGRRPESPQGRLRHVVRAVLVLRRVQPRARRHGRRAGVARLRRRLRHGFNDEGPQARARRGRRRVDAVR